MKEVNESVNDDARKIITRISAAAIAVNVLLIALKIIFGLIYGNLAVISDAIHSGLDITISLLIIVAIALTNPKRSRKSNFAREKIEPLITLFLAIIITGISALLVWQGINGIMNPEDGGLNWYLIGITILSLIAKEAIFWVERHYAKKFNSAMLKADAWHSRIDGLSSLAVLIGLITSGFVGNRSMESIAVLVVAALILHVAVDAFIHSIKHLRKKSAKKEPEETTKTGNDTTVDEETAYTQNEKPAKVNKEITAPTPTTEIK